MSHAVTSPMTFFRRRTVLAALVALAASAALTSATSAHQTLVHTQITRDGSIVVSGYDGGVALAPSAKP